jgi:hypothetical protein
MSHGTMKPRNEYLHKLLMSKRGEAHEPKIGKNTKRAKVNQATLRELRREGFCD